MPYHVIKNAQVLQVRFRNGEVFDDVKYSAWMSDAILPLLKWPLQVYPYFLLRLLIR